MTKHILNRAVIGALVLSFGISAFAQDLLWQEIGGGIFDLKTVLVDPANPKVIYIGAGKGIFKTEDGGRNWRNILSIRGKNRGVNFLLLDPKDKHSLYAATSNGLFCSFNQGSDWVKIFKGKDTSENECTTAAILPSALYLGTKGGLFISKDSGRTWQRQRGDLGNNHIITIVYHPQEPDYLYVASTNGIFISKDSGQSWEKIFLALPTENEDNHEEEAEDQDEPKRLSVIRYMAMDTYHPRILYLATTRGVYISEDRGTNWKLLPSFGLLQRDIRFLLISPKSHLYAVIKSGIFAYNGERWEELSLGLPAVEVRFLALDSLDYLYAACDQGLFKAKITYFNADKQGNVMDLYGQGEPKIKQVQQAAMKYAEVEPEKIIQWRKQAAKKAWLPEFSIGINRDTGDLWHWETGSTTRTDDDILRRGQATVDWDVALSWDLGEILWNDDQTSIDVRSRLTVQLRDDILDEVTKLYFERIRIKMELDNLSLEDRKKRFEKELRLQELTAYLDGLTGGYFSQRLKEKG